MDEKRERQFRELGLTISYYRKLKGLTQLQLANAVGLSRTHISNIEAPRIKTSLSLEACLILQMPWTSAPDLFNFREQQQQ
ncbi:helix-turn-helix transcriptional regulator [Blautia sp. LMAG:75]|uniref:helix-turn-helix transcriptional regulator n=1 Tax=Blautia sp. LMAG:75 TaxID=1969171 RepID=UPI0025C31103|nr:helix-turn-helix transcriptional regulator [Blautia sp. LMAG:75]